MNQQQIKLAQQLFSERDRLKKLRDDAERKGGFSVAVNGSYQDDEMVNVARRPVLDLISQRIKRIEGDLQQLGWDGK
ncbi:hypothetical protein APT59_09900 [Pseudomonas oryzihabitans]|uniref:Uncharacterized protein n=1 Tax=Pseudomonas oryzihabitans TaxID=47885 RepID=A0A0U4WP82_9PSED|nr:hypothetical protein [Pseudomonas oryzihabitans]ALZ84499.1 hypothetical protein APT59_09900 [Pseudomonas oryzihabitans]